MATFRDVHESILRFLEERGENRFVKDKLVAERLGTDPATARFELEELAKQGDVELRNLLGTFYVRLTDAGRDRLSQ